MKEKLGMRCWNFKQQNEHFENLTFKFTEKYPVQKVKYMYLQQNQFPFCISFIQILLEIEIICLLYIFLGHLGIWLSYILPGSVFPR